MALGAGNFIDIFDGGRRWISGNILGIITAIDKVFIAFT